MFIVWQHHHVSLFMLRKSRMLSSVVLFLLVSLGKVQAAPALYARDLISNSSYFDPGLSLVSAVIFNITNSTNSNASFVFSFIDDLRSTGANGLPSTGPPQFTCYLNVTGYKYNNGTPTIDLPSSGIYQPCKDKDGSPSTFQFIFPIANTGKGFPIGAAHAITVNGGPTLVRNVLFDIPALSEWREGIDQYGFRGNISEVEPEDIPKLRSLPVYSDYDTYFNLPPTTSLAPAGWRGDEYKIDLNGNVTVYNRTADHAQRKQRDEELREAQSQGGSSNPTGGFPGGYISARPNTNTTQVNGTGGT